MGERERETHARGYIRGGDESEVPCVEREGARGPRARPRSELHLHVRDVHVENAGTKVIHAETRPHRWGRHWSRVRAGPRVRAAAAAARAARPSRRGESRRRRERRRREKHLRCFRSASHTLLVGLDRKAETKTGDGRTSTYELCYVHVAEDEPRLGECLALQAQRVHRKGADMETDDAGAASRKPPPPARQLLHAEPPGSRDGSLVRTEANACGLRAEWRLGERVQLLHELSAGSGKQRGSVWFARRAR